MGDDQARPAGIAGTASTGGLLEIACDESGSEGEKLIGGNTDVFAHAGVGLSVASAAECVQETRNRIRSPAVEYKANHLLREKHRAVLEWLLGPSGPIHGNAHVHLVDKEFLLVGRLVELLAGEITGQAARPVDGGPYRDPRAGQAALVLYRDGREVFGRRRWDAFLESFNDLVRARTPAEAFFRAADALRSTAAPESVAGIVASLARAGPHADLLRGRPAGDAAMPVLDPLIPAIVQAVLHWGRDGASVSIVHDRHNALTPERVARLTELTELTELARSAELAGLAELAGTPGGPAVPGRSGAVRPAGLRLVDSMSDPRVQVADFLAGVARRVASDELNGRGDTGLVTLLRPYVTPSSIWGDPGSRLLPARDREETGRARAGRP
ncbi:hypothetical protein ACIBCT_01500 [Streptosporangium sp. NPDC050855]|uniref:hypothetical protein n=1 Tax=Streptosporangium sp. NPDC050855 TaxID=3366194 RepID=UPI0037B1851C